MKNVAQTIDSFEQEEISILEKEGEISILLNEKNVTLSLEDVIISSQNIEGWLVASSGGITVALDVTISPSLRNEGIARELVNRIQNLRKDSGFEVTDRVEVEIEQHEKLQTAVNENLDYIKEETLTEVLHFEKKITNGIAVTFDGIETKLSIKKH